MAFNMNSTEVLLLGGGQPWLGAVISRLTSNGFEPLVAPFCFDEAFAARPAPAALILAPPVPKPYESIETLLADLDEVLIAAGLIVRDLVARHPAATTRIVVVAGWEARGLGGQSTAGSVGAGMVGLARSWSLELSPQGVTANAVLVGPFPLHPLALKPPSLAAHPDAEAVAHAVAFFCAPAASSITGQVVAVCGGRSAGSLPP